MGGLNPDRGDPVKASERIPRLGSNPAAVATLNEQLSAHGGNAQSWGLPEPGAWDLLVQYPESEDEAQACRAIVAEWRQRSARGSL